MKHSPSPRATPMLSIVIPAYNEADRLPENLRAIRAFLLDQGWDDRVEVIVVDDGSQDDTVVQVAKQIKGWPGLAIITLPHSGKGGAIRQGVMAAKGEYVFFCDADLAMPIAQITRFLPPERPLCDIVIASREAPGAHRYNEPQYRHIMGRVFNWLVRRLAAPGLNDTQCGFKCFTRAAAQDLCALQRLNGLSFDVELLALARVRGYSLAEVPIDWHNSADSRVRPVRDTLMMFRDVWQVRRRLRDPGIHRSHDPVPEGTIEASGLPSPHKALAALRARRAAERANSMP